MMSLEEALIAWQAEVEAVLSQINKRKVFLSLNQRDRLKLLNLKVWMLRYKVSLRWLLEQLTKYWKARYARHHGAVLGCRIGTLVGRKSQSVIEDELLKLYPSKENEKAWRSQLRLAILSDSVPAPVSDPTKFVVAYRRELSAFESKAGSKKYTRRRYRGNPFL